MTDPIELAEIIEAWAKNSASNVPTDPVEVLLNAAAMLRKHQALQASLFDAVKHGDQEHMDWLKKAIDDHFAGRPVEYPRGQGNAERAEAAEAEVEKLRGLLAAKFKKLTEQVRRDTLEEAAMRIRGFSGDGKFCNNREAYLCEHLAKMVLALGDKDDG